MERIICLCEDTLDGIFTAIYKAWEIGTSKTTIEIGGTKTRSLFAEYIDIQTNHELALKVATSISSKISALAYTYVYKACLSDNPEKANIIYRFLIKGFKRGEGIVNELYDDTVLSLFELARKVNNEAHRYLGFVRFEELENGVLLSKINPKSNVIPIILEHFADRLHNENWIILDTDRNMAAFHRTGVGTAISYDITEETMNRFSHLSRKEEKFHQLWNQFFATIGIEARQNEKLQKQMMPLRYRKYM